MLEIRNVSKKYENEDVLNNVSIQFDKGDFYFLRGASGSGKSTLLKILYREIDNYSGSIFFHDINFKTIPKYITRQRISTIFQTFELLEQKTVLENVLLAGFILGKKKSDLLDKAFELIELVGLKGKEHRFPHQLSGGEQQRVAIARALLNNPEMILADEPTGNLDPENAKNIIGLLDKLNKEQNVTMLIVTHSNEIAESVERAKTIMMNKGVILSE
jgi:cell division transport system ATP-binding protein